MEKMMKYMVNKAAANKSKVALSIYEDVKDKRKQKFKLSADSSSMGYAVFLKKEHLVIDKK